MAKKLLQNQELEWSDIVANNTMNRKRKAIGINSYEKDILLNPIEYINNHQQNIAFKWLDVCCGEGNALIETGHYFINCNIQPSLTGIDLVNFFSDYVGLETLLTLEEKNIHYWNSSEKYDLITLVHGLHYLGDKLQVIQKLVTYLTPTGKFIANIDFSNIEILTIDVKKYLLDLGFEYNEQKYLLSFTGNKQLSFPFEYLGADTQAGPNYTGQNAVNSIYKK